MLTLLSQSQRKNNAPTSNVKHPLKSQLFQILISRSKVRTLISLPKEDNYSFFIVPLRLIDPKQCEGLKLFLTLTLIPIDGSLL